MILTTLMLDPQSIKRFKITDDYSIHRVVYGLFEDVRTDSDKESGKSCGILYADKGGNFQERQIIILSDRPPVNKEGLKLSESIIISDKFLSFTCYRFEINLNPVRRDSKSGKLRPLKSINEITEWFLEKSAKCGFAIEEKYLEISINNSKIFNKGNSKVTLNSATVKGQLNVVNRELFTKNLMEGIGRGKAFGFGLLQIIPVK